MGCRPPGWLCCVLPGSDRWVGGVQHQNCGGGGHSSSRGGCTGSRRGRKGHCSGQLFTVKGLPFRASPLVLRPWKAAPCPAQGEGAAPRWSPASPAPRAPRVCRWTPNCAQERGAPLQPWRRSQSSRPTAVCRGHRGGSPAGSFSSVPGQTQKLAPQTPGSHMPLHRGQRGKCLCILCVCFPITGAHPDIHNALGGLPVIREGK